jgi:NADH:ubiquinone oxidoreductase subunit H
MWPTFPFRRGWNQTHTPWTIGTRFLLHDTLVTIVQPILHFSWMINTNVSRFYESLSLTTPTTTGGIVFASFSSYSPSLFGLSYPFRYSKTCEYTNSIYQGILGGWVATLGTFRYKTLGFWEFLVYAAILLLLSLFLAICINRFEVGDIETHNAKLTTKAGRQAGRQEAPREIIRSFFFFVSSCQDWEKWKRTNC